MKAGTSLFLFAAALLGCNVNAYCFSNCESDGGSAGHGGTGTGGVAGQGGGFSTGSFMGNGGNMDCGDTQMSLENCGECGKRCDPAGAVGVCVGGECLVQSCLDGLYDIDQLPENGCEYACPISDLTPEFCDGVDNDCDSLIDDDDPDLVLPSNLCNTTAGTPCAATTLMCNHENGWSCVYPPEVETVQGILRETETLCDGIDGNCDGAVDEWFTNLGDLCSDMALGQCRDYGLIVCDPSNPNTTRCDTSLPPTPATPSPEACDNIDNDCNGFVDDNLPDSAFDMALLPNASGVRIDRFEASRPDATTAGAGLSETVACSKPNVLPWTNAGYVEAENACKARGPKYRLCSLTEVESACRGSSNTDYPYGAAYQPTTCNGVDAGVSGIVPTGSLAGCVSSPDPISDLSGNAAEWTRTQTNAQPAPDRIFALSGGSYLSPKLTLACTVALVPRALESTLLSNIGFRCCKDP
ncbi:MAG: MopE-related protein [Polyangiaceae bacterium]